MTDRPLSKLSSTVILDHLSDPIFIKDKDHNWVYVNEAMCKFLSKTENQLIGKNESFFMPLDAVKTYWKEDDNVLDTGKVSHKEEEVHFEDHTIKKILTKKSKIVIDDVPYVFGIIRDVTEISALCALNQLGELGATLAHELMTPLTIMDFSINNYSEKMQSKDLSSEDCKDLIAFMNKSKNRLMSIIKSVRSFVTDSRHFPLVPTSLKSILEEAFELASPRIELHKVKLLLSQPPDVNVMCRGPQLSQILINLLHNAADAVSTFNSPWIKVSYEVSENWCEISVIDRGEGIPPEIANKLMTPFFTTKPASDGTGLGLSLASKLASEHGGSLVYDATHPNTCFRLKLPIST